MIGVNSGAGFAVMLSLMFGSNRTLGIPIAAFAGSLAATLYYLWSGIHG